MTSRQQPSVESIASAQAELVMSLDGVSLDVAHMTCWACLYTSPQFAPERAHIHGVSNGGDCGPSNYFLLCWRCHNEQPDGAPRATQEAWLKAHEKWTDRYWRNWREPLAAILKSAADAGDTDLANLWLAELGEDGFQDAWGAAAARSCASNAETALSNARWGLVAAFDAWVAERKTRRHAAAKQCELWDMFGLAEGA